LIVLFNKQFDSFIQQKKTDKLFIRAPIKNHNEMTGDWDCRNAAGRFVVRDLQSYLFEKKYRKNIKIKGKKKKILNIKGYRMGENIF
jgi:hypothetical protein